MFIILKKNRNNIFGSNSGAQHPQHSAGFYIIFPDHVAASADEILLLYGIPELFFIFAMCVCVCVVNFSLNTRLNVSHLLHFLAGRTMQRGAAPSWADFAEILCLAILFVKNHADIMNLKRHTGKLVSLFSIANDDDVQKREMFYCIYVAYII